MGNGIKRVHQIHAKIECVATDLSPAYTAAIREAFPDAVLVYDHFHVIKMFNEVIDETRKRIYREIKDKTARKALKGIRYILLKRPENLNSSPNEPERLRQALESNEDLSKIYILKEDFNRLWSQPDKTTARSHLQEWLEFAYSLEIKEFAKFCNKFKKHIEYVLNFYDSPISTGPLEGINNKIKTLKRQSYGFRDAEYFALKILALHRSRYALVG
ncbi:MAG: ISL3 family transposase [Planctomycetia bacterium]|nr:ISL3 family transposase [Planctomycetia bacterium]